MTKRAIAAMLGWVLLGAARPVPNPYAPLARYDGVWTLTPKGSAALSVRNVCRRAGTFFACEQAVDDKTAGLLVFLPAPSADRLLRYRAQFLHTDLTPTGGSTLTIDGDDWVYADVHATGAGPYTRTLNHFSGPDRIHFTQQSSADGEHWTTTGEGDEVRSPGP